MPENKLGNIEIDIKMRDVDYFRLINELKEKFELETSLQPTHLFVNVKEYYKIENSESLLARLIHIKDTTQGVLGHYILGLKVVKCINFEGIRVGYLL